jgi:hypothetical protein
VGLRTTEGVGKDSGQWVLKKSFMSLDSSTQGVC